jgi:hypothetical protein
MPNRPVLLEFTPKAKSASVLGPVMVHVPRLALPPAALMKPCCAWIDPPVWVKFAVAPSASPTLRLQGPLS